MDDAAASSEHLLDAPLICIQRTSVQFNRLGCLMRDSDREPFGPILAAALVARVIAEVDKHSIEHRDELLLDLMCAAWPSRLAQDQ
jgi:hypothetical protein